MAQKTITLTGLEVLSWRVDVENERVVANYQIVDDWGGVYSTGEAVFWRSIPELADGPEGPTPTPDNWYQLPDTVQDFGQKTYLQVLAQLTTAIESALIHLTLAD